MVNTNAQRPPKSKTRIKRNPRQSHFLKQNVQMESCTWTWKSNTQTVWEIKQRVQSVAFDKTTCVTINVPKNARTVTRIATTSSGSRQGLFPKDSTLLNRHILENTSNRRKLYWFILHFITSFIYKNNRILDIVLTLLPPKIPKTTETDFSLSWNLSHDETCDC